MTAFLLRFKNRHEGNRTSHSVTARSSSESETCRNQKAGTQTVTEVAREASDLDPGVRSFSVIPKQRICWT